MMERDKCKIMICQKKFLQRHEVEFSMSSFLAWFSGSNRFNSQSFTSFKQMLTKSFYWKGNLPTQLNIC